jgi:TRAP-type C4-dicarboxylate transport system permease small subunit
VSRSSALANAVLLLAWVGVLFAFVHTLPESVYKATDILYYICSRVAMFALALGAANLAERTFHSKKPGSRSVGALWLAASVVIFLATLFLSFPQY